MVIPSQPSSRAISKHIQNDKVFPTPISMHPIMSLPEYNARTVLTWYQQGHFPNFACTKFWTSWIVHFRGVLGTVVVLRMPVEEAADNVSMASVHRFS